MKKLFCDTQQYEDCDEIECDSDDAMPMICKEICLPFSACMLCEDSCQYFNDSYCDEQTGLCPSGSDCSDCGPYLIPKADAPPPLSPPPLAGSSSSCSAMPRGCATCLAHIKCIQYLFCATHILLDCNHVDTLAGVCIDAPRMCMSQCLPFSHCLLCTDTCDFNEDDECDDGGVGSEFSTCSPGSDCTDCGPRGGSFLDWSTHRSPPPPPPPSMRPPPPPSMCPPPPPSMRPPPSPHESSNAPPTPKTSEFPKAPPNSSTATGGWVFFWICFVVFGLMGLYAYYRWYSRNPIDLTATRLVSSHPMQLQPMNTQAFESATSFQHNNT